MATQSPFSLAQDFLSSLASSVSSSRFGEPRRFGKPDSFDNPDKSGPTGFRTPDFLSAFAPPAWAVDEAQHRIVLLLNHILAQEKEATSRLARQKGQVIFVQWRFFAMKLVATPAGLLDLADPAAPADLTLSVTEESPIAIAQAVLRGDKPGVRIEGDVQLAAEINWLADHIRWDIEEDLSRVIGDVPAHMLGRAARGMAAALRPFVAGASSAAKGAGQGSGEPGSMSVPTGAQAPGAAP